MSLSVSLIKATWTLFWFTAVNTACSTGFWNRMQRSLKAPAATRRAATLVYLMHACEKGQLWSAQWEPNRTSRCSEAHTDPGVGYSRSCRSRWPEFCQQEMLLALPCETHFSCKERENKATVSKPN